MKNEVRPTQNEGGLGRREFLLLTSSCAAATLALGPNLFGGVLSPQRDVAIGFLPIDAVTDASDRATAIVSADSIPSSDGSFLRHGVKVTLAGIRLGSESRRTIALQPRYIVDGTTDTPVDAWRFTRSTSARGGLGKFGMPIEVDQRLRFSLITGARKEPLSQGQAGSDMKELSPITFSLLSEPDVVKLTRGYYVIVPLHDGVASPRFYATTLRAKDGNMVMQEMRNGSMQPVDREHFVLLMNYATSV